MALAIPSHRFLRWPQCVRGLDYLPQSKQRERAHPVRVVLGELEDLIRQPNDFTAALLGMSSYGPRSHSLHARLGGDAS